MWIEDGANETLVFVTCLAVMMMTCCTKLYEEFFHKI